MSFDRTVYFDSVRASLFAGGMSQQQVDGQNAILDGWEAVPSMDDLRWLAYMLATVYHECAKTMWPIEEYGKGAGMKYGKPDPETGQTYYGRGFVQLTWRDNYARATAKLGLTGDRDIEWHADRALDLDIASAVMFGGMSEGWFTGKHLGQYFSDSKDDPVNARAIINNDVSKMGQTVAGYHRKFLTALTAARRDEPELEAEAEAEADDDDGVIIDISLPAGVSLRLSVNGIAYGPS